ncbi:MAG: Spy/CpxP family protein refolding chaperone [Burkholderiales bacterium]|nr:Spy/CpxP family protein refolding chaperone [Burkholderiales bacterium]
MSKIFQKMNKGAWRPWLMASTLAVVSAASVVSVNAWAEGGAMGASRGQEWNQCGPMMGGAMGARMGEAGGLPFSGRHLARVLDDVKATDAQRTQIKAISEAAEKDIKTLHQGGLTLHEQALALFAKPKIDAAAAEKLRQDMSARHDAVSKRVLQAALDIGNVLTPEQRAQWVEQMQKRHERMKEHMKPQSQKPAQP